MPPRVRLSNVSTPKLIFSGFSRNSGIRLSGTNPKFTSPIDSSFSSVVLFHFMIVDRSMFHRRSFDWGTNKILSCFLSRLSVGWDKKFFSNSYNKIQSQMRTMKDTRRIQSLEMGSARMRRSLEKKSKWSHHKISKINLTFVQNLHEIMSTILIQVGVAENFRIWVCRAINYWEHCSIHYVNSSITYKFNKLNCAKFCVCCLYSIVRWDILARMK